jgi:hypothetical protein
MLPRHAINSVTKAVTEATAIRCRDRKTPTLLSDLIVADPILSRHADMW